MWQLCQSQQEYLLAMRRALHQIPELGTHLPKTQAYVAAKLEAMEVDYRLSSEDSGIIAEITGGQPGKTVALRADMDALPIPETTGVDYTSTHPGCMHACGHDAHTAMLLGAAKVLKAHQSQLKGSVRLLFQTAEEVNLGAPVLLREQALEGVDAVFGLHIGSLLNPNIPSGTVVSAPGCCMASMDKFIVSIHGTGCHGSTPEKGVDPINIASHIVISLQEVIAREFSATRPVVLTVGKISGGSAFNIIPSEVTLEGTIRAIDQTERERLATRIEEISAGVAATFRGVAETTMVWGAPPVVNDADMATLAANAAAKVVGEDMTLRQLAAPNMGGEDFAFYLEQIPGAYLFLSSSDAELGTNIPHHNGKFQIDESVLWKGSATFVSIVEEFLA